MSSLITTFSSDIGGGSSSCGEVMSVPGEATRGGSETAHKRLSSHCSPARGFGAPPLLCPAPGTLLPGPVP